MFNAVLEGMSKSLEATSEHLFSKVYDASGLKHWDDAK